MTACAEPALDAVQRLREALEEAAGALAAADLDGLLNGEARLELAAAQAPALSDLVALDRTALRRELERTRSALLRCQRLGDMLNDFVRLTFDAQGRRPAYGPRDMSPDAYGGRRLDARV